MAIKYFFEFTDVKEILHRCEIHDTDDTGTNIEVNGTLVKEKADVEDILNPIKGGGVSIYLEANLDLTFDDLYAENERTFYIKYYRDGVFDGFYYLAPEGLFQSYVMDKWIIRLDCTDGLGFLSNLSYVDEDGYPFTGKQTDLEIIVNCLKRTEFAQPINTSIKIHYTGLSESVDVLDSVNLNVNRFVKEDKDTIMNCKEVLQTVLEPYSACITQRNGEWYIYQPNELYNNSNVTFYKYTFNGVSSGTEVVDFSLNIGSDVDGFYPHHSSENQQISTKSSIGAYKINYKYGFVKGLLDNIDLYNSGGGVDDWTFNGGTINSNTSNFGFDIGINTGIILGATSDVLTIAKDDVFTYSGSFITYGDAIYYISSVEITDGVDTYYLSKDGNWTTAVNDITIEVSKRVGSTWGGFPEQLYVGTETLYKFEIIADKAPIAGDMVVKLYSADIYFPAGEDNGEIYLKTLSITPEPNERGVEGENHIFQRTTNPSTKIAENKEVFNGDNPSDLYIGAIYKADGTTPTDTWSRNGLSESKPLLRLMGENRMRMYGRPLKLFSGSVFGYVDYLNVITINNLSGKYMPITYSYDASQNITNLVLLEILDEDVLDIYYSLTYDYGNVVEPTIIG